jgi:nucleoside 2-deoxyribosyltransferase
MKLYLAHPFDSRKEMQEWELGFEKRTGIQIINPFYDEVREEIIVAENEYRNMSREEREELVASKYKQIVEKDLEKICKTDGFIVIINHMKSIGAIMEMVYAHQTKKPVYTVAFESIKHPWVKYHSTELFSNLDELEKYLIKL